MTIPSSSSTHHYKTTTTTADDADADCDCDVNNGGFYDTTQYHQPPGVIGQAAGHQRITTRQQQQQRQRQFKYSKVVVWLPIVVIITFLLLNRYHQLLKQTNLSFEELEYHDLYTYIEPPTAAVVSVSSSSSSLFSSSSTITTSSLPTNSSSSSRSTSSSTSKNIKINWKMKNGTTTTTTASNSSSSKSIKINWKKKNGTSNTTTATTRSAITSSSPSRTTNNSSSSSSSNSSKPLKKKKKKRKRKKKKKHTTTNTTDDEAAFNYNTTSGFVLWRNYNASIMSDGNLMIEFFNSSTTNNDDDDDVKEQTQKAQTQQTNNNADAGFSACLINLEDTIRLTEWIPYHYTILPLTSLVIAIDPKTSELGLNRTLELIELWSDRIQITLWPSYKLPPSKRFRPEQSYIRERQVYFANSCLKYHSLFEDRSWTLLTDNDEYLIYNYPHMNEYDVVDVDNGTTSITIDKGEYIHYDHPSYKKKKIQQEIELNRRKYMHWRFPNPNPNTNNTSNNNTITENSTENNNNNTNNHSPNQNQTLPMKLNQTIFQFIKQNQDQLQLPICVRIPGIHYGGSVVGNAPTAAVSYLNSMSSPPSSSSSSLSWLSSTSSSSSSKSSSDNNILTTIDPNILSTYRYIYHEKRKSKFSKVMIDVSRINTSTSSNSNSSSSTGHVLDWSKSNHAKTIHNPNRILCGYNGVVDSGTDYYSSLFRVNHYIGSIQSYLERKDDYRSRSMELYHYKFHKIINVTKNPFYYDYDILPWMDLFLNKCHHNITLVKELLFKPLTEYNK